MPAYPVIFTHRRVAGLNTFPGGHNANVGSGAATGSGIGSGVLNGFFSVNRFNFRVNTLGRVYSGLTFERFKKLYVFALKKDKANYIDGLDTIMDGS